MALMDHADLKARTKRTSHTLFHTLKGGREVLSQPQRELCAVAALTALHRPNEVRAHIHAALNVGATRQEVAEVIFQMVTDGGMPVVVDALEVYGQVLAERGEPFPAEEPAR
jgi:alkylhydroperoxidase/carboxymuconolactone decarboxylase family protein YurZ